ncbi:MAG: DUF362 domain-containing protein [Chloroflexi bacterium]|nr:DUF362 domain-containing protein [Chloroflexota bacterium]
MTSTGGQPARIRPNSPTAGPFVLQAKEDREAGDERAKALLVSCLALHVLDGVEALTSGGPDVGNKVEAGVVLAGVDRVALDAVGVAILRHLGTTAEVRRGRVFEQEQIARAVELGLGVAQPEAITLLADDADGRAYADQLRMILEADGS